MEIGRSFDKNEWGIKKYVDETLLENNLFHRKVQHKM